ncbi:MULTISPECIES: biosynthetic-type acetolactate synthase large subunit [unclassified Romboutsia]|uniref:biosynthetic-type acetolactate synthase large subunit n=1 Tax=unclassified Romboutsia TaxID=2626894 RepID=UPI00082229AB|nr:MULTISPECIES: biosynthetic-type acetolactate synthase large subunit [unclassified Romboutsia]SCH72776.1 Acetolactate synthase isozyme 2 large subunit [uncultured Clostridium sp.]
MQGARIVLECLKKEGVNTIFGYPGGAVIPLYDALYDYKNDFKHVRTSHEQGLVHAADGYARSTGKVAVCFVTSGPGATNAVTGIATAYMDSSPLVVISGQVPTTLLGKDSFQEIDITGVTLSITKHNYLVRNIKDIAPTIKEAFKVANTGRKGPVLIDIPKDLFLEEIDFNPDNYTSYLHKIDLNKLNTFELDEVNNESLNKAIDLIHKSKKPIIYAGGGVKSSNAEDLLLEFAKKIDTPVVNTLMGLGSIDRKDKLSLGLVGMHGSRESNLALSNSDLVIAIGARFSDRVVGKTSEFAKKANIIHIDIDPSELNKNVETDVVLTGDVANVLKVLINSVKVKNNENWKENIKEFKEDIMLKKDEFHPKNILKLLNQKIGSNSIVVTDVGQHQMWTAKYWEYSKGKTLITSAGLGTMGFGLGAAIGSKVGNENKLVVLVTGDGSFRMNCNELATVSKYRIPIVIVLLNNGALGMVRQWQKLFSHERYSETDIDNSLDYVVLAKAYNIDGYSISDIDELNLVLNKVDFNKPIILQCNINKDYNVYPIVPPNDALENLICH